MNRDSDSNALYGGVVVVVVVLGALLLKVLQRIFDQLTATFDAFGHMVGSFLPMLLNIAEAIGLVALMASSIIVAVYFTSKYVELVYDATDLRWWVGRSINTFKKECEEKYFAEARSLRHEVAALEKKVEELLKPASAASPVDVPKAQPEPTNDASASAHDANTVEPYDRDPDEVDLDSEDEEDSGATTAHQIPEGQPY